ncbi:hypothetical protein [Kitasatospora sp. NBC_00374]|uniref:arsenate reductase/protein-tyrosine-phosphatase family protein n=1 Tax=Kitasatospora sp. NBC_00374 TaxID=2975964 RepID=UPI00352C1485
MAGRPAPGRSLRPASASTRWGAPRHPRGQDATGLASAVLAKHGGQAVEVRSAGLRDWHVGKPAHPVMVEVAARCGYDLGALAQPVLGRVAVSHLLQPLTLGGGQGDRACESERQPGRAVREKWMTTGCGATRPSCGVPPCTVSLVSWWPSAPRERW